jgi:hypothetical protein
MGINVCYGYKGFGDKLDLIGTVHRVAFDPALSNHRLYALVYAAFIAPLLQTHPSLAVSLEADKPLYNLVVSNSWGSLVLKTIPNNANPLGLVEAKDVVVILLHAPLNQQSVQAAIKDSVQDLSLPSPEPAAAISAGVITLYDCLNKFIERETLASTETLYCTACKQHLSPIKKMDIYSTPDILILHLKRFQFIPGQYFVHREKIAQNIVFPITGLDLKPYIIGKDHLGADASAQGQEGDVEESSFIYDLYAVSHHMGGLGGGHYTATCLNPINRKWYVLSSLHLLVPC